MISNLSAEQLRKAAEIKEQIDSLQTELNRLIGIASDPRATGKQTMSAAAKARIAEGQKRRWAKVKGGKAEKAGGKRKRTMTATARAKIAAAAKARWAKAKAGGRNSL
jgi:hypothetical protein